MKELRQAASLALPARLRARLEASARAAYPCEACGLLLGRRFEARVEVVHVRAARNLEPAPARDRYELDPADHLAAEEAARALGLEVVGIWHSHPDRPAVPSEIDRARAWQGWSYLIVPVLTGVAGEPRAWRLQDARFHEEEVCA